jgi:hypothetical protein
MSSKNEITGAFADTATYDSANGIVTAIALTGNVTANYILANGAFLTGLPAGYANANVANYLPTYTGNIGASGTSVVSLGNPSVSPISPNTFLQVNTVNDYFLFGSSNVPVVGLANLNWQQSNLNSALQVGGNIVGQANITSQSNLNATGATVTGNVSAVGNVSANYFIGNGSQLTGLNAGNILVTSNVTSLIAGQQLKFAVDYSNASYTQGIWTLYQIPAVSVSLTSPLWVSTLTTTKLGYANYAANTTNPSNVRLTLGIVSSTFNIQSSDYILIGTSNITGTNITTLGISGAGGTYNINQTLLDTATESSTATVTISARLTTAAGAITVSSATNLLNTQPSPFTVNSITVSFPSTTVPFWSQNQIFNWSVSLTGTATTGTLALTGSNTANLTTTGGTAGTSASYNSTTGTYTLNALSYAGAGLNGAGSRVAPNVGPVTVTLATSYYPVFTATTQSITNPALTTSNTHGTANFAYGNTSQGSIVTSGTVTDYMWIGVPNKIVPITTLSVTAITQANPGVVTTSTAHGFTNGQAFQITGATGMSNVNSQLYYTKTTGYGTTQFALYLDPNQIQGVNTTSFPAYTGGGTLTTQTTFEHDDQAFPGVVDTPVAIYSNQAIANETYTVYGFTNFNSVRTIYTVAP